MPEQSSVIEKRDKARGSYFQIAIKLDIFLYILSIVWALST